MVGASTSDSGEHMQEGSAPVDSAQCASKLGHGSNRGITRRRMLQTSSLAVLAVSTAGIRSESAVAVEETPPLDVYGQVYAAAATSLSTPYEIADAPRASELFREMLADGGSSVRSEADSVFDVVRDLGGRTGAGTFLRETPIGAANLLRSALYAGSNANDGLRATWAAERAVAYLPLGCDLRPDAPPAQSTLVLL
jgi:hypothetical protein